MKLKTNQVLDRYNFLSKIVLKKDSSELSKDLKVKIMKAKIEYGKITKAFQADVQEFGKELDTKRYNEILSKKEEERTEDEVQELQKLTNEINSQYILYQQKRLSDEVEVNELKLSEDEYNEIVEVNADNDVEINNQKLQATDFLEAIYDMFV